MTLGNGKPTTGRMKLGNVVKGRIAKPVRVLLYGPPGIGKTTFAAAAPVPIFIGAEDGTSELDVERFPQPGTWSDVLDALDELATASHSYQTVVLDTLDWLEPLCWQHVCTTNRDKQGKPYENIKDLGYGKGYAAALDQWRILLKKLEELRDARSLSIVLLAHTTIRPFKNPEGDNYERYQLKLHHSASSLFREWPDAVLFAMYETYTHAVDGGETKGISTGARVMGTQRTAAYDAKNRYDLPDRVPLDWPSFAESLAARPAAITAALEVELERATDDVRQRAKKKLADVGPDDMTQLKRITIHLAALNDRHSKEAAQ